MNTSITLIGNLTRDPELRFTAKGLPVASLSVAVNERVKEGDGWVDGPPSYYDITAWRNLAEAVTENLRKGDRVLVVGSMKIEKFEDREGNQRSKPAVTAEEVARPVPRSASPAPAAPQDDIPPF